MRAFALLAILVAACSSDGSCPHTAYCDGNVLVGCETEGDETTMQEYRNDCGGDACVQPDSAADAFCSWSAQPVAECQALPDGGDMTPACVGDVPATCEGGYPEGTIDTACGAGQSCIECDDSIVTGGRFAGCGIGSAAEPACDATTKSACDAGARFDCNCGWRATQTACDAACVDVDHGSFHYGLCAFSDQPDPSCPTPMASGDSSYCAEDTLTWCFLGYAVFTQTCEPGMCETNGCVGLPTGTSGMAHGGVSAL